MIRKALSVVSIAFLLGGCQRAPPTPDAAYFAFLAAVHGAAEGKPAERVLDFFDRTTRAALATRAHAASKATDDYLPDDAAYQLFLGVESAPEVKGIHLAEQDAASATLEIELEGAGAQAVQMVREAGAWKIHLGF